MIAKRTINIPDAETIRGNETFIPTTIKNTGVMIAKAQEFEKIGLEFHTKADELGNIAKTKDLNKTLLALDTMLKRCNQCHSMFKQ